MRDESATKFCSYFLSCSERVRVVSILYCIVLLEFVDCSTLILHETDRWDWHFCLRWRLLHVISFYCCWEITWRRSPAYTGCSDVSELNITPCRHVAGSLNVNKELGTVRKSKNYYTKVIRRRCVLTDEYISTYNSLQAYQSLLCWTLPQYVRRTRPV